MQGFVEELVVNDDPEYQWIDKIRSMRASNEARQLAFSRLTGTSCLSYCVRRLYLSFVVICTCLSSFVVDAYLIFFLSSTF